MIRVHSRTHKNEQTNVAVAFALNMADVRMDECFFSPFSFTPVHQKDTSTALWVQL